MLSPMKATATPDKPDANEKESPFFKTLLAGKKVIDTQINRLQEAENSKLMVQSIWINRFMILGYEPRFFSAVQTPKTERFFYPMRLERAFKHQAHSVTRATGDSTSIELLDEIDRDFVILVF